MDIRFKHSEYFENFGDSKHQNTDPKVIDNVRENPRFNVGSLEFKYFAGHSSKRVINLITAPYFSAWHVANATYFLAKAIVIGIPKAIVGNSLSGRAALYTSVRHLEAAFGRLLLPFYQRLGQYLIEEAEFHITAYRCFTLPQQGKVKNLDEEFKQPLRGVSREEELVDQLREFSEDDSFGPFLEDQERGTLLEVLNDLMEIKPDNSTGVSNSADVDQLCLRLLNRLYISENDEVIGNIMGLMSNKSPEKVEAVALLASKNSKITIHQLTDIVLGRIESDSKLHPTEKAMDIVTATYNAYFTVGKKFDQDQTLKNIQGIIAELLEHFKEELIKASKLDYNEEDDV